MARNYQTKTNKGGVPDSIVSTKFGAGEFNSVAQEIENFVTRSGQTLAPNDGTGEVFTQMAESAFLNGTKAQHFQDGGSANVIELTPVSGASGVKVPASYANMDGAHITFFAAASNTGATTLNLGQTSGTLIGAKAVVRESGSALSSGDIDTTIENEVVYDLSNDRFVLVRAAAMQASGEKLPTLYKPTMRISNGSDADHDIDVTTGVTRSDDDAQDIIINSALTKQMDVTFAEGTNVGGFASGESLPTDGTIHIWAIVKSDGTADVFANNHATSGLSPTLPSGFVAKRRIASLTTDASANIESILQVGNRFIINNVTTDVTAILPSTAANFAIKVPSGVKFRVFVNLESSGNSRFYFADPDKTSQNATNGGPPGYTIGLSMAPNSVTEVGGLFDTVCNTSAEIAASEASGAVSANLYTIAYEDYFEV